MSNQSATALPADETLQAIEATAAELAARAGTEITTALGRTLAVRYKGSAAGPGAFKDPVSEVDREVEQLMRDRLAKHHPEHDIIGEEMDERPSRDHDFVWVVDPIDGTTNFVNGLPLFAAAIGVLYCGMPVVGALWCSTSHAVRPGVYHARAGGRLRFENELIEFKTRSHLRRRLVGEPVATPDAGLPWDVRKTGSAALECAFVAAGLLQVARFERPNIWDVGGGIALVHATGGRVLAQGPDGWQKFERFEPAAKGTGQPDLSHWSQPLIVGEAEAVEAMVRALEG
jgi:myo-inositol-1(or 4)-monophosphatase